MDPLLIIHGSVYWIEPLDMWINHPRETAYTTAYKGFRAYLLTVTTDTLRFLASSRASPGHRSAASTVFLKSIFTGSWATLRKEMIHMKPVMVHGLVMILMPELYKTLKK